MKRTLLFALALLALTACALQATQGNSPLASENPGLGLVLPSVAAALPSETPSETPIPSPTPRPQPTFPDPAAYSWELVIGEIRRPLLVTHAGDGTGRLFVVGQDGLIQVLQNGAVLDDPFLDITERVGSTGNEQGLLGLAFHPDYEQNGSFYVNYTDTAGNTVIARYQVSGDPNVADAASEQILLQVDQPYENHNGGHLEFGPDGYLYIGLGDGGSQGDPSGNGQSLETYLGKLLRIDVDSASPYAIPPDNPFGRGGGLGEIWAYGLRNPWRFSFDRTTGDLYVADVGQGEWEEVNFLPGGIVGGTNFGWNYFEGSHPYQGTPPDGMTFVGPVAQYAHSVGGCAVTGGYVYRGAALPAWQGVYFYGDFCSGDIWGLLQNPNGEWESRLLYDTDFLITSFGLDEAGELYVLDRSGGLYQLQAQ